MNKQLSVWNLVAESLKQEIPIMLLYVLESSGSSPGRQGFFMAVNKSGEMEGSIGGGIMEHKFVEMAKDKLSALNYGPLTPGIKKQVHDKSVPKDQSGMICSGKQSILLYPLKKSDALQVQNIISSLEQFKNGSLQLSPGGILFSEKTPEKDFHFTMRAVDDWFYEEKTGYKNLLSIIGGGHCTLALSKLMHGMDFYIRAYDDRRDLKTMQQNNFAHEKIIVEDYSKLGELIHEGNNHYVVIMTFGYRTDDIALKALLGKKFKYIGLLGSKKKIEKMFDDYRKAGFDPDMLQLIHSPVGLVIKSQTPEEIAVSIASEIIKVKNKDL